MNRVIFAGMAVVLVAAAVLSFSALRDLAVAVAIPAYLAWLLPVAVDAGASVSCATWLSRRVPADAARFARAMTWALLALTVVGNAAQLGMHAHAVVPPWPVAVAVGAVPPVIVGGVVHLAVLTGRRPPRIELQADDAAAAGPPEPVTDEPDPIEPSDELETAPDERDAPDRAAELIAAGAGRTRLARELGVSEHEARQMLAEVRPS